MFFTGNVAFAGKCVRDTIYIPFFTSISPHIGIIDGGGNQRCGVVVLAVPNAAAAPFSLW
jgi:hypothetical protein